MRIPKATGKSAKAVALAAVLALLLSGGAWWAAQALVGGPRITAYFNASVGLFPGSDVRVLGMRIGSVSDVVPQGTKVRVDMQLDDGTPVPADAKAVAVAPSLVSDRYVQLTPVYEGGPQMRDGAVIPRERTATPLELDEINRNTDELLTALGPDGANENGALSDYLDVAARNLEGNGDELNDMLRQLGQATSTLSGSKEDMYVTVDNLQKFTRTLADSDQQVHRFNTQLADTASFLASERGELGQALQDLGPALEETAAFIENNRGQIKSNVEDLRGVTQVLVDQRAALAEVLEVAPLGLSNLSNAYEESTGTLRTRGNINELTHPPIVIVCKILQQSTPAKPVPPVLAEACERIQPIVDGVAPLPSPAEAITSLEEGKPPELPLPLARVMREAGAPGGDR